MAIGDIPNGIITPLVTSRHPIGEVGQQVDGHR